MFERHLGARGDAAHLFDDWKEITNQRRDIVFAKSGASDLGDLVGGALPYAPCASPAMLHAALVGRSRNIDQKTGFNHGNVPFGRAASGRVVWLVTIKNPTPGIEELTAVMDIAPCTLVVCPTQMVGLAAQRLAGGGGV